MAEEDIVQKVKLEAEGGDKVAAKFDKASKGAQKAADEIRKIGESSGEGLSKVASNVFEATDAIAGLLDKSKGAASRFSEIAKAGDDFATVASSISQLGDTAKQAFATLAEAAQKLGANAQQVQFVETAINALGARSETTATSFKTLAENFDLARGVLVRAGEAAETAGESLEKTGDHGKEAADGISETGDVSDEAAQKLTDLATALDETLDAVAHISTGLNTMAIALGRLGPVGATIANGLRLVSGVLSAVDTVAGRLGPSLDKLIDGLRHLGPTGEAAAKGLERIVQSMADVMVGATGLGDVLARLGTAIHVGFTEAIAAALAILGPWGIAIVVIVAAIGLLTGAVVYFGNKALEAAERLRALAEATGQTVTNIQQGEAAFQRMGLETAKYGEIAKNVADIVAEMGPTMSKAMDDAADSMDAATKSALKAEEAMLKAKIAAHGVTIIGESSSQLDDIERLRAVRKQLYSEEDVAARALIEHEQQQRRLREQRANDIRTLIPLMRQAAEGAKGIKFDFLTTDVSKIDAVKRAITQLADEGKDAIGGAIEMVKNLPFREANELGKILGFSEEDISRLRRYGVSWQELRNQIAATGKVPITQADADALENAQKGATRLRDAWNRLQSALNTPIFSRAAAQADSSLSEMTASVLDHVSKWLEAIIKFTRDVGTYFEILPTALSAVMSRIKELWFSDWAAMAEAVAKVFDNIPTMGKAAEALKQLAASWRETASQAKADQTADQAAIAAAWARTGEVAQLSGQQQVTAAQQVAQALKQPEQGFLTFEQVVNRYGGNVEAATRALQQLNEQGSQTGQVLNRLNQEGGQAGQQVAQGFEKASPAVDEFKQKVADPPDFAPITGAATSAAQSVSQSFASIDLSGLSSLTVDFSGIVNSATDASDQIKTAFSSIGTEGFTQLLDAAQTTFDMLSQQAQTTAQGLASAFEVLDFSGLITQINNATSAFQDMEQAAYAAAKAAQAASAASGGNGASGTERGLAIGGLFRGNPGTDTNLAWLSDYEFVMRREAVMKYGVSFMQLINAGRFAEGGLVGGFKKSPDVTFSAQGGGAEAMAEAFSKIGDLLHELGNMILTGLQELGNKWVEQGTQALVTIGNIIGQMGKTLWEDAYRAGAEAQEKKDKEELASASERGSGGLFRGRPGRDTNLAWLTDYEYVMRPEAVQKYGVAFMEMINSLAFGGFRSGGLVMPRIAIPAFQAGGINGGGGGGMVGRPLTLVLDGQRFPNLSGPTEVVDGLEKHATLKKASRIGRAPSWVK